MPTYGCFSAVLGGLIAICPMLACADADEAAHWVVEAHVAEESVGRGLPVLALVQKDWYTVNVDTNKTGRAWRSVDGRVAATHPSGWQVAAVVRAQAELSASADTVALLVSNAQQTDPTQVRSYGLALQAQGWLGDGVTVETPWLALHQGDSWQGKVKLELLTLRKLLREELSGAFQYQGNAVYDFDAQARRSQTNITGPYLAAPGASGQGGALSLSLQGLPKPGLHVQFRVDDLLSRLVWERMPTDAKTLKSQVTTRAADGTLDYGPVVSGRISLETLTTRIAPHWQANAQWAVDGRSPLQGAITLQADHKAGISQAWVGWENQHQTYSGLRWTLAAEPWLAAMRTSVQWRGFHAVAATDFKGVSSRYRQVHLGWRMAL